MELFVIGKKFLTSGQICRGGEFRSTLANIEGFSTCTKYLVPGPGPVRVVLCRKSEANKISEAVKLVKFGRGSV